MRIAYFTDSLPPLMDGVTRTLAELFGTLVAERLEFRVVAPMRPGAEYPWAARVRRVASVPVPVYDYYRLALPYFQALTPELDRFRPDLVHVVSPTPLGLYGLQYAQARNIPAVTSYHTHYVAYLASYGLRGWEDVGWAYLRWFHNQFVRTYAPSRSAARELEAHGIRHVELWARGIDLSRFGPAHRSTELRAHLDAGALPVLLFVGRLVKEKDLDDLVVACGLLRDRGRAFRLVLVGDGPMRGELAALLPDAILPGFRTGDELARWYASADLFVFPSTTETFGNVLLEAFASGLPAVGVTRGGAEDLIEPGVNGVLARPNDPRDWADRLEFLLGQPAYARWLGKHALDTARAHSWERVNHGLLDSYCDLLADAGRVPLGPSDESGRSDGAGRPQGGTGEHVADVVHA